MAEYIQNKTRDECNSFHYRNRFQHKSNQKIIENIMKKIKVDPK